MNFVFVIDSSVSMAQTFEGMSFFEAAKSAIQSFVYKRESYNNKNNLNSDKYMLLTLHDDISQSAVWNVRSNSTELDISTRSSATDLQTISLLLNWKKTSNCKNLLTRRRNRGATTSITSRNSIQTSSKANTIQNIWHWKR